MSSRCLICPVNFESDLSNVNVNVAKIYNKIFSTFCKYFSLTCDEGEIPFNFQREALPFCDLCRDDIVKLCRLDRTMDRIQNEICHLIANITQSILQSEDTTTTTTKENVITTSSSNNPDEFYSQLNSSRLSFHDDGGCNRKISRYRNSIKKKFNPTVVLHKNYPPSRKNILIPHNNNNNNETPSSSLLTNSHDECGPDHPVVYSQNSESASASQNLSYAHNYVDDDFFDGNDDEVQQENSSPSDMKNVDGNEEGNVDDQMEIEQSSHSATITTEDFVMEDTPSIIAQGSSQTLIERIRSGNKKELTKHEFLYYGTWPVKRIGFSSVCQTCGIFIGGNRKLFLHMKNCHGDPRKLQCPTCHEEIENEPDFIEHLLVHPDRTLADEVVPCGHGKFLFDGRWFFDENKDVFLCTSCGMETRSRETVVEHLKSHKNGQMSGRQGRFECNMCHKTFLTYLRQCNHMKRVHRLNRPPPRSRKAISKGQSSIQKVPKSIAFQTSLVCPVCGKKYSTLNIRPNLYNFVTHMTETHPEANIRRCIVDCGHGNLLCDAVWLFLKNDAGFQCQFCGDQVTEEGGDNFREHIEKNHSGLICETCGITCRSMQGLTVHQLHTHPFMGVSSGEANGKYRCSYSSKIYYEKVERNVDTRVESQGYRCSACAHVGKDHQEMIRHIQQHNRRGQSTKSTQRHTGSVVTPEGQLLFNGKWPYRKEEDGKFKCGTCGQIFMNRHTASAHLRRVHEKPLMLICETCGKSFSCRQDLLDHQTTHSDLRLVKCSQCDRAYKTRTALYIHTQGAHDPRTYPCGTCGKSFKTQVSLAQHAYSHSDVRYTCQDCPKTFSHPFSLQRHRNCSHGAEKPFACPLCSMRFTQGPNVGRHMRVVHSESRKAAASKAKEGKKVKKKKREKPSSEEDSDESRGNFTAEVGEKSSEEQ